jgi:hypothetical protein
VGAQKKARGITDLRSGQALQHVPHLHRGPPAGPARRDHLPPTAGRA